MIFSNYCKIAAIIIAIELIAEIIFLKSESAKTIKHNVLFGKKKFINYIAKLQM